jgi:membrane protein implicated in regulation of membrane protease activity
MSPLDIVFWSCFMLGGGYLLVSVLLGGVSDVMGLVGGDGAAAGGAEGGSADAGDSGHSHTGGHAHLLSLLSPLYVSALLAGFGGVGLVSRYLQMPAASAIAFAALGGFATWGSAWYTLTQVFGKAQGTSHNRQEELIGRKAVVSTAIAGSSPGMVTLEIAGSRQSVRAITDDDETIPNGAVVRIRKIEKSTVHVVRIG